MAVKGSSEPPNTVSQATATSRIVLPRAVVDAVAGAAAGAVARLVVSPLDVIKIRFQVITVSCITCIEKIITLQFTRTPQSHQTSDCF